MDPTSPPPLEANVAPVPLVLRLLSGIAGVVVFLIGLIVSFGAILAAPVGLWLVGRWTQRRGLRPSRVASLVGSVLASVALAAVLWSVVVFLMPRPTSKELQSAVTEARNRPRVTLPGWYLRAFPQAAQMDSANQQLVQSPTFMRMMFVVGAVFLALFFGVVGGALGWCGSALLRLAWSGPTRREVTT